VYHCNSRADTERVTQVLAGLVFPAAKWQLIMKAEEYGADGATRAELWALPTGSYRDLPAVLGALAAVAAQRSCAAVDPRLGQPRALHAVPGRVRPLR
jgi:Protein of unknown function (DUF2795)